MNDELEARLRAHFAQRAADEPLDEAPLPEAVLAARPGPGRRRALTLVAAAAAVVAVVAAGLALGGGEDDRSELDVVDDATTTTEAPATTTTTATTVTTTATTAVPASGDDVRSVVVAPTGILGRWDGSSWLPVGAHTDAVVGGERFTLVNVGRPTTTAIAPAPIRGCRVDDPVPYVPFPEYESNGLGEAPIGVLGVEQPEPRPVTALDPADDIYRQAAADLVAGLGIDDPAPAIVQLLRADLDADGIDEVLLTVERLADDVSLQAEPGDYSVTAVRRVVDGQVETQVLHQYEAQTSEDFPFAFIVVGRFLAVADLNGDGRMEVVTSENYYEGSSTMVNELQADGLVEVLAVGCGA